MKIFGPKFAILLTVFIGVLGIGIIIPILPFYVESFNVGALTVTSFFAVYSFCSFLSAPILGAFSDKYGRRPVLIISGFATTVGWLIFASSGSLFGLFIGRIIEGLASGNISAANSYLSDISKDSKERSANLGLLGAVFGVGFIIGPALGGFLSKISLSFPFWFAAGLSFFSSVLTVLILPESLKEKSQKALSFNPFVPIIRTVRKKMFRHYFIVWFLFNFAISMMQSVFALYLFAVYGFREIGAAIIMSSIGVIIAFNQGFALRKFWIEKFKEKDLMFYSMLALAFAYLFFGVGVFWLLIVSIILNAFSQSLLRVVITSEVAGLSDASSRGESLGVLTSVSAICMSIAPLIAGFIFEFHVSWPFYIASLICFIAFVLIYFERNKILDIHKPAEELMY